MGACGSRNLSESEKEAMKISKKLDKEQENNKNEDDRLIKLLLLGAGESGKSTIFKQMRQLYGVGFDEESRIQLAPIIRSNLIFGVRSVLENFEKLNISFSDENAIACAEKIEKMEDDSVIDQEIADAITTLWKDKDFIACWEQRSSYQLYDCFEDFANGIGNFPSWGGPEWIPSISDVLKARVRTSGIVEEAYTIDGISFRMYDVGGQRNERKKWIHCFDNVTAVIFVSAISEYDQVLYEDKSMNRVMEALALFEEISNSKWFQETSIILFLNKKDLFIEKFCKRKVQLNVTGLELFKTAPVIDWATTSENEAFDQATSWIIEQFLSKSTGEREIYHHITCATDTENVATVFNACKDIILKNNLKDSGFMS